MVTQTIDAAPHEPRLIPPLGGVYKLQRPIRILRQSGSCRVFNANNLADWLVLAFFYCIALGLAGGLLFVFFHFGGLVFGLLTLIPGCIGVAGIMLVPVVMIRGSERLGDALIVEGHRLELPRIGWGGGLNHISRACLVVGTFYSAGQQQKSPIPNVVQLQLWLNDRSVVDQPVMVIECPSALFSNTRGLARRLELVLQVPVERVRSGEVQVGRMTDPVGELFAKLFGRVDLPQPGSSARSQSDS